MCSIHDLTFVLLQKKNTLNCKAAGVGTSNKITAWQARVSTCITFNLTFSPVTACGRKTISLKAGQIQH